MGRRSAPLLALGFSLATLSPALAAATSASSSQGTSVTGTSAPSASATGASASGTSVVGGVSAATRTATLRQARLLIASFYAVKVEPLWNAFTPDMRDAWVSLPNFLSYRQMGVQNFGAESRLLGEDVVARGDWTVYIRTAVFAKQPQQVWQVLMAFDKTGKVALFNIVPAGDLPDVPTTQG